MNHIDKFVYYQKNRVRIMIKNKKNKNIKIKKEQSKKVTSISNDTDLKTKSGFLKILTSCFTPYIIIFILGFSIYFQCLNYDLTGFDDTVMVGNIKTGIANNSLLSAFNLTAMMTNNGYFYRPVQLISLMLDSHISSSGVFIYHLSNLIFHLITCCLLFYLITLFKIDKIKGLIFTLIFLVHPLFNQVVIWIPSRGDLLVTMFGLMSFIFLILFYRTNNILLLIVNIITFFLAVFSKEIAALFPLIYILYYLITSSERIWKWKGLFTGINLIALIGWLLIVTSYLLIRMNVVKFSLPSNQAGIEPFIHNLPVIPETITKFIFPFSLSVVPQFNALNTIIGLLLISVSIFVIIKYRNKFDKYYLLYILWFFTFTLTPLLFRHFHLDKGYDYLEHRTYLPMIGILMLIISFDFNIKKINNIYIFGLIVLVIFSGITFSRETIFENTDNFYKSAINKGTGVALVYFNYAVTLIDKKDSLNALQYYTNAINLKDDYIDAFTNRALLYKHYGKKNLALQDLNKILEFEPNKDDIYFERAKLMIEFGKPLDALNDYNHAIKLNNTKSEYYNNRGNIYYRMLNYNMAEVDYKQAVNLKPDFDYALNALGSIYGSQQKYSEAIIWFQKAVKANPKNSEAWLNLGLVNLQINDIKSACESWQKAEKLGNRNAEIFLEKYCR